MKTYTRYMVINGVFLEIDFAVHEAELPHAQDGIELLAVWVNDEEIMEIIDEKILDKIADEILKGEDDE